MNRIVSLIVLAFALSFAACTQTPAGKGGKVSPDEFEQLVAKTPGAQIIDVRTPGEFESGHVAGAVNIDINGSNFESGIQGLDKTKPVFVYCKSGGRSSSAVSAMRSSGFDVIYEMPGMMAWLNAGKPVVTGEAAPVKEGGMSMEDYQKAVTNDKMVLVDFNAVWCKPCKVLSPILDKIGSDKKEKLIILKVDADENEALVQQKGIDGIPYLELYKDGKMIWMHKGMISETDLLKETGL
ncbi:MAG: thioredoxin domain-containing protein [bacterium]|nr:thioredoxin domain-containing protein [bacterium]